MPPVRPIRLRDVAPIGVDRMGAAADADTTHDYLRLENLDTDIAPDPLVSAATRRAAEDDAANSYLPFVGQQRLRSAVAEHVSRLSGLEYSGERHCIITPGGLAGILNVLLATLEVGDEVVVQDPTYAGLLNRIRIAGGVPRFVPFHFRPGRHWTFDAGALQATITSRTRAMLLMSPSMPSGATLTRDDWDAVAQVCRRHDLLLVLDSAMERLLFDDPPVIHPAGLPGMRDRTIIVGSASKELRMIGWRIGWIVAPDAYMPDLVAVSLANCVVPVGIAQTAAAVALEASAATLGRYIEELRLRRDALVVQLQGFRYGMPQGGWSLLLDVGELGFDGVTASALLLKHGVCATAMAGWGRTHGSQYVRFVYSNEPASRLARLGPAMRAAFRGHSSD